MAISLHNSNSATPGGASPLTGPALTAAIGEIVVIQIDHESVSGTVPTVSSISDGTGNVYAKRVSATRAPDPIYSASEGFEVWWAYVANTLTASTISVSRSASVDDAVIIAAR